MAARKARRSKPHIPRRAVRPRGGTFGTRLLALRNVHGYTQKELGKLAGVGQQAVCKFESGFYEPSLPNLRKLVKAFGLDAAGVARLVGVS